MSLKASRIAAPALPGAATAPSSTRRKPDGARAAKVARILAAARDSFTRGGYEATSMDAVAAQAGVGKATIYAHFGSKSDLFSAVVSAESELPVVSLSHSSNESLERTLRRFAADVFALILAPANTEMFRMISAEHTRFSDLGQIFFQSGPVRLRNELAAYLAAAMARGELRRERPDIAAAQFLALICGDLQVREFLGAGRDVDDELRQTVLNAGLDTFLRAYQLRSRLQEAAGELN